jgi:hypothetical protein
MPFRDEIVYAIAKIKFSMVKKRITLKEQLPILPEGSEWSILQNAGIKIHLDVCVPGV